MHGFSHRKMSNVHIFEHKDLGFILKLLPNGQSSFCLTNTESKIVYAPIPAESLLGAPYQPENISLGYHSEFYANAIHEMIHIIYSWLTANRLSPNHKMLLGLGDIPIPQADNEEIIITGLQIYANSSKLPDRTLKAISNDMPEMNYGQIANLCEDIKSFHDWLVNHCNI